MRDVLKELIQRERIKFNANANIGRRFKLAIFY